MTGTASQILAALVRIPSVTGEERKAAEAVAEWCERAKLRVELSDVQPGRPNVVARWGTGRRPVVLLTGHLDTVPVGEGWTHDPFGAEVQDGRLYGRGACDMKGGLAAMLGALSGLRGRGLEPAGDVVLAAVVGEEEDSAGTLALVESGLSADRALLAEPTGLQLVRSNRGLVNYRLEVLGAAAHASEPQLGENAIVAASQLVVELDSLGRRLSQSPHPTLGAASLTVGTIRGGTRPYVVPERCELEVDRRVNPGETAETVRAETAQALEAVRQRLPGLRVRFELGHEYLPFELPEEHPFVEEMAAAMSASGVEPRLGTWRAASDAGFLVGRAGIPCLLFGPGEVAQAHRPDEFVDLQEVELASQVCSRLLLGTGH